MMAIPIINDWEKYFQDPHEGLGSSYERVVLNGLLLDLVTQYQVQTALESPSFGFTGLSGINLLALADVDVQVTLEDNERGRLDRIAKLWQDLGRPLKAVYNPDFRSLDYPDRCFDLAFSFSALWFVPELRLWLNALSRVTDKAIFLSVPNRDGLGYKMQLRDYSPERYPQLRLGHIDPPSVSRILTEQGWTLRRSGYFDCPPWPDIGMTKEELLGKWLPWISSCACSKRTDKRRNSPVSILKYYSGGDPEFVVRMQRLQWLEKAAPQCFKRVWAHHFFMLFDRGGCS